jgi:hydroxymethylpyrimidine pyrophosphatase-like HAD family hydrolase
MISPEALPDKHGPVFEAASIPGQHEADQARLQPVFSGGPVEILALSNSPDGFDLQPAASLRRRDASDGTRIPLKLTDDQRARLSREFQGPQRFNTLQASKAAKAALRAAIDRGAPEAEVVPLRAAFVHATELRRSAPVGGEQRFNGGVLLDYARKVFGYSTTAIRAKHRLTTGDFEAGETAESAQAELDAALSGWNNTLTNDAQKLREKDKIDVEVEAARATLDAFMRGEEIPLDTLEKYRSNLADIRAAYASNGKKSGIRNINVKDNKVGFNTVPVQFGSYTVLAQPDSSPEAKHISMLVGTAAIPITSDGRLIVQRRAVSVQHLHEPKMSPGNRSYTGDAGAGIAGVHDATYRNMLAIKPEVQVLRSRLMAAQKVDQPDQGLIDEINTQIAELESQFVVDPVSSESVKAQLMREGGEEIGIGLSEVESLIITGIANDKMKDHQEITGMVVLNKTAAEIHEISRNANRNVKLGEADFAEKWFDIPATPEAIETLLTKVRNPIPPTHTAAYVGVGHTLMVQRDGAQAADEWLRRVEAGVAANYAAMDAAVAAFYEAHPTAYDILPERFWSGNAPTRNRKGVDPSFAPEEQGLKPLQDALVEAGLIEDNRTIIPVAELYDADGVFTHPDSKAINHESIRMLAGKLRNGVRIGINTGRSIRWAESQIIPLLLEELGGDRNYLSNFVVIGEKAGAWEYLGENDDGEPELISRHSTALSVPDDLKEHVDALVAAKYSHLMGDLDPKTTMISVEKKDGVAQSDFDAVKSQFAEELRAIVAELGYGHLYKVDATTIAVDVENANVGKAAGTVRFVQWLKDSEVKAEKFNMVGDSPSDIEMALEAERLGLNVVFFYVGPKAKLAGVELPKNIVITEDDYDGKIFDEATIALMRAGAL